MSSNFTDDRGTITDLMVTPEYSVTHITFKKGAVRGNHYHKNTTQVDIVLKGSLFSVKTDVLGSKSALVLAKGSTITHLPNEKHAYSALVDAEIISLCWGIRKGTDYEKDVFRLEGRDKLI